MNIIIQHDYSFEISLSMAGYSTEQFVEIKKAIKQQFKTTATEIFQNLLDKPLPEVIKIIFTLSDNDELKGSKEATKASFHIGLSNSVTHVFKIHEITIRKMMDNGIDNDFKSIVIHEMFHAADLPILRNNIDMFNTVRTSISRAYGYQKDAPLALLSSLKVFEHFRAEGIAIMGELLLTKVIFKYLSFSVPLFHDIYNNTMDKAIDYAKGNRGAGNIFDREAFIAAYQSAPVILLIILNKTDFISDNLFFRIINGFFNGLYNITDQEVKTVMRSALSLTLSDYIQGMTLIGDSVIPMIPILQFFYIFQGEYEKDNLDALISLIQRPESAKTFNTAMTQLMRLCIPEEELDKHVYDFIHNSANNTRSQLKDKILRLHYVLKNDTSRPSKDSLPTNKRIAQWALTYFFDKEDFISDNTSGFGLTDDLLVLDYALNLLTDSPDIPPELF